MPITSNEEYFSAMSEGDLLPLVTSNDVLHSWAVPALGIKIDACPGRLNEVEFLIYREGTFYGQCSEICGFYHGFMPIVVECKSLASFATGSTLLQFFW